MIIDAHTHLGEDFVFDEAQSETQLLEAMNHCGVNKAIVQPFVCRPYLVDTRAAHDRIARMASAAPGRIFGMASINPHFRPEDFEMEARRCVQELGFVGLKITPVGHAVNPSSRDGLAVFEVARALGVPVMIHTGLGGAFAAPISAWKAVKSFPEVKVILAHAGGNEGYEQARLMAQTFPNVYLEPSWMPSTTIGAMVREFGPSRVLFSSDLVGNLAPALATFRVQIPAPENLDAALWKTAHTIFGV